ncbi:probable glutathione S-transferase isoform X2 [Camellia sinensis]|uniref:probable glutathione S-transferase isoform X1 n=1 Tax=Camellia sinensis TaxID=4442 RepID=UPI001036DE26|nr:probable glutathione S-transferase isoform X1 [Camellia sinensis]XP_028113799.1 probable glutathione S-transferase isoform X2 [Camellia sinensis]
MADEIILLGTWISIFSTRVKIALAEKEVDYEFREEDLSNKSPLLLKANPVNKQIPVLIHNGKPVYESLIIVEYIDEVWNHKSPLLPSDPHQLAQARFWADYVDKKMYIAGRQLMFSTGEAQETVKNDLIGCLKVLEGELGDKPYFGGETFGIVDVALIPNYSFFFAYEQFGNFSIVAECPALVAWVHRCMEKKSVSKHLPDQHKVYDCVLERKKKLEAE